MVVKYTEMRKYLFTEEMKISRNTECKREIPKKYRNTEEQYTRKC